MQKVKTSGLQRKILKTLVYSDIFDYPLTVREMAHYLISDTKIGDKVIQKHLKVLTDAKQIYTDGDFYFFKNRNNIVELRKQREEWSKEKWEIARKTASKLKMIPTVKMIGVTGALAMGNCKKDDDVDLLIITSRNSLWLTRLLLVLSAPFLGINRRKPNDLNINNKICFNLFLDEDHLKIEPENLFLAHEIAQVKVIYDKDDIYEKFMQENKWVRNFLPNNVGMSNVICNMSKADVKCQMFSFLLDGVLVLLNWIVFYLQYLYMKPKITIERVSLHQAFFHPNNINKEIENKYKEKLYTLDLDKTSN